MPIGIFVNCSVVLVGGIVGNALGTKIPERLRTALPMTFGIASMAMGIVYIIKMKTLPAVILALVLGAIIGELIYLEKILERVITVVNKKLFSSQSEVDKRDGEFIETFIAVVILFCAGATGIFGSLTEGLTGDHSILFTKSILDLFTAIIFGTTLGIMVAFISIPQIIIFLLLYSCAGFIMPLTNQIMIDDFVACGGILILATGFRISKIKFFAVANLLPSLILVMPISYLWTTYMQ